MQKSKYETNFNKNTESLEYKIGNNPLSNLFIPCGEMIEWNCKRYSTAILN